MLTSLTIQEFTLVERLDIEFDRGMTAITGETGTGKSLILDALGLALGDRGDTERIRLGADKAEVCASFLLSDNTAAQQWLDEWDFDHDDECLIKRSLTRDGRSRGFINGQPATMSQLRQLGALIIDIHNQHEHQSLLARDHQRTLLDDFGGHQALCTTVARDYGAWLDEKRKWEELQKSGENSAAQQELLTFQLEELEQLNLADGEIEALEGEQLLLANAEAIITDSQEVLSLCDNDDNAGELTIQAALNKACATLEDMPQRSESLQEALTLLDSARIQVSEAVIDIQHHLDSSEVDPTRLQQVEERLSLAYQLARKHKVSANELTALCLTLRERLNTLANSVVDGEELAARVNDLQAVYLSAANKLSRARTKVAGTFSSAVNGQLAGLAMGGASIEIALSPLEKGRYSVAGLETIDLLVSTNPGQPHRPLNKVASGGELSRISLAIQVVAAEHSSIPVLVFDEVDVGVGGATASVIGKLLRSLGDRGQVICISHQPQVASHAQHHLVASKSQKQKATESLLNKLDTAARKEEIARMLGGEKITKKTLSHAEEMLALGSAS